MRAGVAIDSPCKGVHAMRKAFTLVELLVVIAILSILMMLLQPALSRAIGAAQTIACASNLKQHNFAVPSFADDHDDFMPCSQWVKKQAVYLDVLFPTQAQLDPKNYNSAWYSSAPGNLFYPYLKPLEKALCPSRPNNLLKDSKGIWQTYRMNDGYMSQSGILTVKKRFSLAPHPSELFLFVDGSVDGDDWWMSIGLAGELYKKIGFHHNNNTGFNAGYFDGHVETLFLNHTPLSTNDPPLTPNNFQ
jgi:prepilin-type N-terminal cleavage/methylation domain-containing protein/prepilin-type processing-associated H-X9-DG protein